MQKTQKTCKVCGTPFTPCKDLGFGFNWRVVTCSPECGQTYLSRIKESRKGKAVDADAPSKHAAIDDVLDSFGRDDETVEEELSYSILPDVLEYATGN